ncbi:MAG: 5-oxoprolinase subunit PxpB [Lachnospiraceae bacterium]|nr:5-oxoprolinase subunit PxpB [Lachnospiraceae bacterium]
MEMRFLPAGDEALIVEFGMEIDDEINRKVQRLADFIRSQNISGIRELLPTFRSLMIFYNSNVISYKKLIGEIKHFKNDKDEGVAEKKKILCVPCCYGSDYGPDLKEMSSRLGMSTEEIIKLHSQSDYKIYMLGFLPGFTYLGGLDKRIHMPRLDTPRTSIPAGSVGIGGNQTGVYPVASPGGWWLIGNTPIEFYNPQREMPVLCNAGEYIRFIPISISDYESIQKDVKDNKYNPEYVYE